MSIETSSFLRLLATVNPRLWEVLFPPQPRGWDGPIPDPWAGDFQLQVHRAARDVARRIVDAAAAVSAQDGDGAAVITRSVDEWVRIDDGDGTGRVPFKLFFPPWWWFDLPRPPRPNEDIELIPALAAAAGSFATIADTIRDPALKQAAETAAQALVGRAQQTMHLG